MVFRKIKNKRELHILITSTMQRSEEPFTATDIVEKVSDNQAFADFCSKEELVKMVNEIIQTCIALDVLHYYPQEQIEDPIKYIFY